MGEFSDTIREGDRRESLVALRDMLAESMDDLRESLKINSGMCRRCGGSLSEAGLASLAQRLKQTLDDIDALGDPAQPRSKLDELRDKRDQRAGVAESPDPPSPELGSKSAERRRSGSRRAGGERWADS